MNGAFRKTPQGLVPASEEAQKMFDRMQMGELCMGEHIRGRIPENHSRFFKLRDETFEIQDSFEDVEIWRKQLQILAGHYEEVIVPAPEWFEWAIEYLERNLGGVHKKKLIDKFKEEFQLQLWPKSIAFDKMDETEFKDMFKRAVNGFTNHYAPQMDDKTFLRIIDFD